MAVTTELAALSVRLKLVTDKLIDGTTGRIAAAWVTAWDEVADEWRAALDELAAMADDGQWPTRGEIARNIRAQKALAATADALQELAKQTGVTITGDLPALVKLAAEHQARMVNLQMPDDGAVSWTRLDPQSITAMVERSTQQITALTLPVGDESATAMRSALIRGVAAGTNPRDVAEDMLNRVKGIFDGGYRRAENIARTEMIDIHREAARRSRMANADVLLGWRWTAALSSRTCPACVAMHGRIFPPDEPGPLGHQSCRCVAAPVVRTWRDLGIDADEPEGEAPPTGPEWFAARTPKTQEKILGPKRYAAYKAGDYPIENAAIRRSTPGWRDSYQTRAA